MDKITVTAIRTSRVSLVRSKSEREMLLTWQTDVLQLPVIQIVPLDNEHLLSGGSIRNVYIHFERFLSDMSLIVCQLSYGFTMVIDSKHAKE